MLKTHEMHIEGHKIVALALNPDAAGAPIILLHGIAGSADFWITDDVFTRYGPCYALNLPGHYPSVLPQEFTRHELDPEMIARVLAAAIREQVGARPVILAGMSTGGFAALAIAAHAPEIARSVISLSGFARGKWTGSLGQMQQWARSGAIGQAMVKAGLWGGWRSLALYKSMWQSYVADAHSFDAYPHCKALLENSRRNFSHLDLNAMVHYFYAMPDIDITDWLARITAPTLVVAGSRDPIVPPEQSRLIAARVPNAELAIVNGAGHLIFAENPPEYQRILEGWLQRF